MDLTPFLNTDNSFTLLMAPPAWGKTRLVLELISKKQGVWIFLSPLRALAEEFYDSFDLNCEKKIIRSRKDWEFLSDWQRSPLLIVTTPESLSNRGIDLIENISNEVVVIVDEFHLFYHWGHDFRPCMWERLIDLGAMTCSMLALTATMSDDLLSLYRRDFSLAFESLYEINIGNGKFFHSPEKLNYFGRFGKSLLRRRFFYELSKSQKTVLYFCRYRNEVKQWVDFCKKKNIKALGCVGGEVPDFIQKMKKGIPAVIFTTTALSHGVNLPVCERVFIDYHVDNHDFWLQMATRAGRRGESFQIYSLNSYFLGPFLKYLSLIQVRIKDVFVRLHLWFGVL